MQTPPPATKSTKPCTVCRVPGTDYITTPCDHAYHQNCFVFQFVEAISRGSLDKLRCIHSEESGEEVCDKLLPREWLRSVGMTKENRENLSKTLNEVFLRSIRMMDCPNCRTPCQREQPTDQRVRCRACWSSTMKDFCFYCGRSWNGSTSRGCGNQQCTGKDPLLHLIQSCPEVDISVGGSNTVKAPQFRLCPFCGMPIERMKYCKTITCPACLKVFCFLCLSKFNDGKLNCSTPPNTNTHYAPCARGVAPRQQDYPRQ